MPDTILNLATRVVEGKVGRVELSENDLSHSICKTTLYQFSVKGTKIVKIGHRIGFCKVGRVVGIV